MTTKRCKTYRDLQKVCNQIPNEHLDDTITLFDVIDDEFHAKEMELQTSQDNGILDDGHPYFELHNPPA